MGVKTERAGEAFVVTIDRPGARNAVDGATAAALADAFREFSEDDALAVLVLTGAGGTFCAGADLKALADGRGNRLDPAGDGPMGPSRMILPKPAIAAVEGYAVAGGLELALLCDLRVAARDATFGVFCRRFGVPLIDGGTVRLPRGVGLGRALDLILTGRAVGAEEALAMGLVNRVTEPGGALEGALALAHQIASFPRRCMLSDRRSAYEQADQPFDEAMRREFELGMQVVASGETVAGAARFAAGGGRHGEGAR
ncbi:MAG TPA: crotonase/enoyl-CoA hydratase family protein [Polyangiaceae bacterium]|nr:crotonase/enoyl-CoA hydratase family protein [Polyangiaceae bacterium]